MAVITAISKNSPSPVSPPSAPLLATSGDTLAYVPDRSQELWLFNTGNADVNVNVDGSGGTTVTIPGAAGLAVSVASGLTVTVLANSFSSVMLDRAKAYLQGSVSITAGTGAVIRAMLIAP